MTLVDRNRKWIMALNQMVAECYLEGAISEISILQSRLQFGNNHFDHFEDPTTAVLPGKVRFTNTLSKLVTTYVEIDNHHKNDATGFSATLLRELTGPSYTLSFRSTEYRSSDEGGDFERDGGLIVDGADDEIFKYGFALAQLVAMERYYREVRAMLPEGTTLNVTGYSLGGHLATVFTQLHSSEIGETYLFNSPGRGDIRIRAGLSEAEVIRNMLARIEELISTPSAGITFPLGSTAEFELFQAAKTRAEQDPGWNPFLEGSTDSIYEDPRYKWARYVAVTEFGPDYALFGNTLTGEEFSRTTSIVGVGTHGDATLVANAQNHVPAQYVFIEDQPTWDEQGGLGELNGDYGTTHSLTLVVDSLALQQLIATLDSSLDQRQIERILAASSFQKASGFTLTAGKAEADSLESALDALFYLLGGSGERSSIDRQTGAFGNVVSRELFYQRLEAVRNLAASAANPLKFEILVGKSAWEIAREAIGSPEDEGRALAYRYALERLNPFVLFGANYEIHNTQNELGLYDPRIGEGRMSPEWIRDRAAMLAALNDARLENRETAGALRSAEAATGRVIYSSSEDPEGRLIVTPSGYFLSTQFVTFDGVENSTIHGGTLNDGLYGGGGNDHLSGFEGEDTLEGGSGVDTLKGGEGDDLLRGGAGIDNLYGDSGEDRLEGGAGDDVLEGGDDSDHLLGEDESDYLDGGSGNDLLEGGRGHDIYVFRSGEGVDTIVDLDGLGRLVIDGYALAAPAEGFRRVGNTWLANAADQYLSFYMDGPVDGSNTLVVSGLFHGQVRIEQFRNGDLGIVLGGLFDNEQEISPTTNAVHIDRNTKLKELLGSPGADHTVLDGDFLTFYGLGGNDVLGELGSVENERRILHGNSGNDVLIGSDDSQSEYGGDYLWGGGGADRIYGGNHDDWLYGDLFAELTPDRFSVDFFRYGLSYDGTEGSGIYWYSGTGDSIDRTFDLGTDMEIALRWALGLNPGEVPIGFYDDFLDGGDGNDQLEGMAGSDRLNGGSGDDRLTGDSLVIRDLGSNLLHLAYLFGEFGDDYLEGGDGDDTLTDKVAGSDVFLGGEGNDSIVNNDRKSYPNAVEQMMHLAQSITGSERFRNYLDGGAGDDVLESMNSFGDGDDILIGGTGNDVLTAYSLSGICRLIGGEGNDDLRMALFGELDADGGSGDDTYSLAWYGDSIYPYANPVVPARLPRHRIRDYDPSPNLDTLKLTLLALFDDLSVVRYEDDLLLGTKARRDWLTVENWFLGDAWKIEKVEITAALSAEATQLVKETWDISALEAKAIWRGTEGPDHLVGTAANETISGEDGDDIIEGGEGNDVISGGNGNNVFRFNARSGHDRVFSDEQRASGTDQVVFEDDIAPTDILVEKVGNDLLLEVRDRSTTVAVTDWFVGGDHHVQSVKFSNGLLWTAVQLRDKALGNHAPVVTGSVNPERVKKGDYFFYQIPTGLFVDPDPGDQLSLTITLESGELLPSWLEFEPESNALSGSPPATQEGVVHLKLTARDRLGSEASITFDLIVETGNRPPETLDGLVDHVAMESTAFSMLIPDTAFVDRDVGDSLSYYVTLSNGEALPSWLSFEASSRRVSGTPGEDDIGSLTARITASDAAGASVSETFELVVKPHFDIRQAGGNGVEVLAGFSGNDVFDGGGGADSLYGRRGNDILRGGDGDDQLWGESGNDVLLGGAGRDKLVAGHGRNILFGGEGNDVLSGGEGNGTLVDGPDLASSNLFIGGRGNDSIQVGATNAIIAFNLGDGSDSVESHPGARVSLSVGRLAASEELSLTRDGSDLRLHIGTSDQLTFRDWYSGMDNKPVENLQFILGGGGAGALTSDAIPHRVESYDFRALVDAFDASAPNQWSITEALLDAHVSGSDSEALGGDLAYRYGTSGLIDRLSPSTMQNVLASPSFGADSQSIAVPPSSGVASLKFTRLGL